MAISSESTTERHIGEIEKQSNKKEEIDGKVTTTLLYVPEREPQ